MRKSLVLGTIIAATLIVAFACGCSDPSIACDLRTCTGRVDPAPNICCPDSPVGAGGSWNYGAYSCECEMACDVFSTVGGSVAGGPARESCFAVNAESGVGWIRVCRPFGVLPNGASCSASYPCLPGLSCFIGTCEQYCDLSDGDPGCSSPDETCHDLGWGPVGRCF